MSYAAINGHDVDSLLIEARLSALEAMTTSYVNSGSTSTLAYLLSSFPPGSVYLGKYAHVSDLYGSVDEILRCRFDGTNYNWVPQRESFAGISASSSGNVSLVPLVTPPTLRMTTTGLTGNTTVTPSSTNAYVGQRFRVITSPALALGAMTMQITGLIGSNITLLAGTTHDIEFGASGWFQSS